MNGRKIVALLVAISLLALISSCSNNTNNPISTQNPQPKELNVPTVSVPGAMLNSTDENVKTAISYINIVNNFKNYLTYFTPSANSKFNSTAGEWTWTSGPLAITLIEKNVDGKANWTVKLNGSDGKFSYSDWTIATAEETSDNNSGHIVVYKPVSKVSKDMLGQWDWHVDANKKVTFGAFDFDKNVKTELSVNPDQSGKLKIYFSVKGFSLLQYKVQWTSNGSGQWWSYDNTGKEVGSGSWF